MKRYGWATTRIYLDVAERRRGDDDLATYLRKLDRSLIDVISGRSVRRWRLERLEQFFSDVADTARRASARTNRCGF